MFNIQCIGGGLKAGSIGPAGPMDPDLYRSPNARFTPAIFPIRRPESPIFYPWVFFV